MISGLAWWWYFPAAALALVGWQLLWGVGLRDWRETRRLARNGTPRRRCGKCWYDMSGTPGGVCAECGTRWSDERELRGARMRWVVLAISLMLIAPLICLYVARDGARTYYAVMPKYVTVQKGREGSTSWTLQKVRDPSESGMRLYVHGSGGRRRLLEIEDWEITFGERPGVDVFGNAERTLGYTTDLDSDGVKELVIFSYSGGAHCCYTVHVIELGEPARIVATIDAQNGAALTWNRWGHSLSTVHNGSAEVLLDVPDQSFDYWNAPHAASPFVSVYYRLRNHRLEVALDHFRHHRADSEFAEFSFSATPDAIKAFFASDEGLGSLSMVSYQLGVNVRRAMTPADAELQPAMWGHMLELMYVDRADEAWTFFDLCWPPERPGKDEFRFEFAAILSRSVQWRDVEAAREAARRGEPMPEAMIGKTGGGSMADPPRAP